MTLARPAFREGGPLTAALFSAEQDSRINRLALHIRESHMAGIVSGLEVGILGDQVVIDPGVALLDSGNVVCIMETQLLDVPEAAGRYSVFLSEVLDRGARGATSGADVTLRAEGAGNDLCLGVVVRENAALTIDLNDRLPIGAVGERITGSDSAVTLSLGLNENRAQPELAVSFADGPPTFSVSAGRGANVTGHLAIQPGLTSPTALRARCLHCPTAGAPPEQAAPWSLRRVQSEIDGQAFEDLRLELHHPGKSGDPARSRVVIGAMEPAAPDSLELTGMAIDATGKTTLFQDGELAAQGINVIPPGRVAFSPVSPGPTDPALAAALTDAMLQGIAWALLLATLNSGITGVVLDDADPLAGITVTLGARETITDTTGRFFLAAAGWPGETVMLNFAGDAALGVRPAIVGSALQVFEFQSDGNNGEII